MTPGTTSQRMAVWLESAWLARYLDRQLSGEEVAWFEAYLLDKPELIEAIEADNALRDAVALGRARDHARLDVGSDAQDKRVFENHRASLAKPRSWGKLAVPASLAAALAIGFLSELMLDRRLGRTDLIVSPPRIVFNVTRGPSEPEKIERADRASPYVLVDVAVPLDAKNVALFVPGHNPVPLASSDGLASFLVSRSTLRTAISAEVVYEVGGTREARTITLPELAEHDH